VSLPSSVIDAMVAAGATAEVLAAAIKADQQIATDKATFRRAKAAERQRKSRMSRNVTQTERDKRDVTVTSPPPSASPSLSPPAPSPITTSPPPPTPSENASHSRSARSALVSDWPTDFAEQFWDAYPKRIEKQATLRKLDTLRRSGKLPWRVLMNGLRRYREATVSTEQQFIKSPVVWLNKGCWDDDPAALQRATGPPRERRNGFDVVREECLQEMENGHRSDDPEPLFDLDLTAVRSGVG
jgi:hypothetical protein